MFIRDQQGGPVPWLAKSYDLDKASLSLTIYLKENIFFSDGTQFDADAAKWNMIALIASGQGELPDVASVDVVSKFTVRVNMSKWDILMPQYFVLKAGNMVSPTNVQKNGGDYAIKHPVATGPFVLADFQTDVLLKYTRNPNYWLPGKPYLEAVQWDMIADTMTRVAAFKNGEGQIVIGISPSQADELRQTGLYDITTSPSQIFSLYPDSVNAESPWYDVRVRQAASYAIDRQAICDAFGYGFYTPTDQIGFPGYAAYDPTIPGYPYDQARARELLEAAGLGDGFDTTAWYQSTGDDSIWTAIQGMWAEVGIRLTLQPVDFGKVLSTSTGGWFNGLQTFLPPFTPIGYPALKNFTFTFSKASIFSKSVIRPDDVEALEQQALGAATVAEMDAINQQINRLLTMDYCVCIPIYVLPNIAAKVKWVHDDNIYTYWQEQWNPQDTWLESGH